MDPARRLSRRLVHLGEKQSSLFVRLSLEASIHAAVHDGANASRFQAEDRKGAVDKAAPLVPHSPARYVPLRSPSQFTHIVRPHVDQRVAVHSTEDARSSRVRVQSVVEETPDCSAWYVRWSLPVHDGAENMQRVQCGAREKISRYDGCLSAFALRLRHPYLIDHSSRPSGLGSCIMKHDSMTKTGTERIGLKHLGMQTVEPTSSPTLHSN